MPTRGRGIQYYPHHRNADRSYGLADVSLPVACLTRAISHGSAPKDAEDHVGLLRGWITACAGWDDRLRNVLGNQDLTIELGLKAVPTIPRPEDHEVMVALLILEQDGVATAHSNGSVTVM